MSYYPIFIELFNKPVLVVGGGTVAYRKVKTLLEFGARVRVVSPQIIPALKEIADGKSCLWLPKEYSSEDIKDSVLIFSCTEKADVNARVACDAKLKEKLINVVDDPDNCTFIVPSILNRGDLSIAISTAGSSPMAARRIREELERIYGTEMEVYLGLLRAWRKEIKTNLPPEKRQLFWELVTDGEVLNHIKNGQLERAKEVIQACFRSLSV